MVCLIGKSVEDFKASYEKMKNSKTKQENRENQEKSNKQESLIKNSDSKAINNKTVREWRTMKVNKEEVKKVVKKAVVLIAASLATISLFACGGKAETKMEYPSISIDQDVNTGNDSKVKVTEEVVKPTEIKETKKYIEETTKPVETTEPAPTQSAEEMAAELNSLLINSPQNQSKYLGTDSHGLPYLQKGQEYTWSENGPNEAPRTNKQSHAVSPINGKKYEYNSIDGWYERDREAEKEQNKLYMEGKVDLEGNPVEKRKMTEEEARQIAKMFSDSFK